MDEFILFLKKDLLFHIYTHIIFYFFLLKLGYKLLQKKLLTNNIYFTF